MKIYNEIFRQENFRGETLKLGTKTAVNIDYSGHIPIGE